VFYKIPTKILEDDSVSSGSDDEYDNDIGKVNRTIDNLKPKHYDESFVKEKLNTTDVDIVKINFNYENLILIENLYTRLLKDFENKKNNFDSSILTWFDFISLNYDVYSIENTFNDKVLKRNFKRFFVAEIILFCITYMRDISSEQIYNALKTCFFYLHQNFIIIMFLIIQKTPKETLNTNDLAKKCKAKVEENNIWINKNTFKTILLNNNKTIYNILKTLLSQIKTGSKDKPNEQKNISIIYNYVKNLKAFKVETIKEKLYEKVRYNLT
jgi:hypothetical protein